MKLVLTIDLLFAKTMISNNLNILNGPLSKKHTGTSLVNSSTRMNKTIRIDLKFP